MPPASASDILPLNAGSIWGTPEEFAAESPDPSGWGEAAKSAIAQTPIGGFFESAFDAHYRSLNQDTGYDSVVDPEIDANPAYAKHRDEFLLISNHEKAAILKSEINRDMENERIRANSSWTQAVTLFPIQILGDPLTYLTLGTGAGWVGLGKGGLMAAKSAVGYSVRRTAGAAAAIGAGDAALVAGVNRAYRTDSTPLGDISNIALNSIISAGIGGMVAKLLTHGEMQHISREVAGALLDRLPDPHGAIGDATRAFRQNNSLSAKSVDELTAEDFMIPGFSARQSASLAKTVLRTPGLYLGGVESRTANLLNLKLTNTGLAYNLHDKGMTVESNVESARQLWTGEASRAALEIDRQYSIGKSKFGKSVIGSLEDFSVAVTKNARRLDEKAFPASPGTYQEVLNNASRALLKYNDWSLDRSIQARLFPEGFHGPKRATGGGNYMTRIYNVQKISKEMRKVKLLLRESLKHDAQLMKPDPGDSGIDEAVDALYDTLSRNKVEDPGVPFDQLRAPKLRGPAKDRTYNISDLFETIDPLTGERIAFEDYLENGAHVILDRHSRILGAEAELARISTPDMADASGFQQGRPDLSNDIVAVNREYADMITAERSKTVVNQKRINKLERENRRVVTTLEALVQKHRGVYQQALNSSSIGTMLRVANNLLPAFAMGGVLLSSLTDPVRAVFGYGVKNFVMKGMPALVTSLRALPLRTRLVDGSVHVNELRSLGVGMERINNHRLSSFYDALETRLDPNMSDRFAQRANRGFYKMTGLPTWTDYWKTVSATVTSGRLMNIITKGGPLNKHDNRWMSRLNLSTEDQKLIRSMVDDGLIKQDSWGTWTFNEWDWSASSETTDALQKMTTMHDADIKKLGKFDLKKVTAQADAMYPKLPVGTTAKGTPRLKHVVAARNQEEARLKYISDAKEAHATKLSELQKLRSQQLTSIKRRAEGVQSRLQQAIITETNRRVVTPGVGDVPLSMGHPVMKIVLAFKSFMFSAVHKAAIAGLQGPKGWLLSELVASHVAHMFEVYVKRAIKGEDPEDLYRDDSAFAQWNAMAIESNLFLAAPMEVYKMAQRMSGRRVPDPAHLAARAVPGRVLTGTGKPAPAEVAGALAGPGGQLADDIVTVIAAFNDYATTGKRFTESKRRKTARLVPGYTLPYVKPFAEKYLIRDN